MRCSSGRQSDDSKKDSQERKNRESPTTAFRPRSDGVCISSQRVSKKWERILFTWGISILIVVILSAINGCMTKQDLQMEKDYATSRSILR